MMDENRTHKRFAIQRGVEIRLASGYRVSGVTRDLSFGGSFIECDTTNLHSGDECTLSVNLDGEGTAVEIFSDIRYHNEYGVGCHFLTFDTGYYKFLTNYSLQDKVS